MASTNDYLKPEEIRALASSFQRSRMLLTAFELDIFTILDKHMLHSKDVAEKIHADERATDRLMNALVALGFLRKVKGKFYNTEGASQFLVKGKSEFMGNLFHTIGLWSTWSSLTESVKSGTSAAERKPSPQGINWLESFIGAMHYRGVKEAKITALLLDFSSVKRILDVGGGSGAFAMEFIKKNPNMTAVIFDLPDVIPITNRYVEMEKMNDKISFLSGDYLADDFGTDYDLIFLSAIVHINGLEENNLLIKKCYDSLNNGGQIVIKDWVMNEDRTEPESGAFFALNMLVGTENGDTYTETEMRKWFANAGINKVERKDTSFGSSLMIGYKE
ncbi:MAG: acetylserotonin O-methyltransferase [Ignavibacteriae bacterium HGW-Ignavibacteriae-3]|nr:MAG: acetylserotonin O-methyltransferase [Ignavibacteriae bacterium HGW-Ignavibacteriae-3]